MLSEDSGTSLECSGSLWDVFATLWEALGLVRDALETTPGRSRRCFGRLWDVSGTLWEALRHLWDAPEGSGTSLGRSRRLWDVSGNLSKTPSQWLWTLRRMVDKPAGSQSGSLLPQRSSSQIRLSSQMPSSTSQLDAMWLDPSIHPSILSLIHI